MSSNSLHINKVNYITPQKYISGMIKEYDIAKANISILCSLKVIPESLYNRLYHMDKIDREIYIGNIMKDNPDYSIELKNGLISYKDLFYKSNGILDENIVSIHNDSLFLLNITPSETVFDLVEFKYKGSYITFYRIFDLEIYYYFNMVTSDESLEVKGINNNVLVKHEDYFSDFIKALFIEREYNGINSAIELLKSFTEQYLSYKLDPGYYREYNSISKFKIGKYYTDYLLQDQLEYVDISYNYNILREIFSIYSSQYFN